MPQIIRKQNDCVYVGIDPGKSGGIAAIWEDESVDLQPMPETELDVWRYLNELQKMGRVVAVIERVHAMPKQGVTSMFTFGQGYGSLRMALTAIGASWEDVPPQTWMKALNVKKAKEQDQKLKLLQFAQQLYPDLELWKQSKSLGRQKAVCDALLIATYCKRKHTGGLS